MDDDNPTEVTAGAIVTVTVNLERKDMSTLFGDETIPDVPNVVENGIEEGKEVDGEGENEASAPVKRPAWLKQKRGKFDAQQILNVIVYFCCFFRWREENKENEQT